MPCWNENAKLVLMNGTTVSRMLGTTADPGLLGSSVCASVPGIPDGAERSVVHGVASGIEDHAHTQHYAGGLGILEGWCRRQSNRRTDIACSVRWHGRPQQMHDLESLEV